MFLFITLLLLTLLSFYLSDTWSQIELIPGEFNSNGCGAVGLSWLILDPNPNSGLASRLVHAREHFARIISSSSTHWSIQLNFSWIFAWCYSCKSVVSCPTRFFRSEQRNIAQSNVLANWSPQQCLQRFHQRLSAINCGLFMPRWVFHCEAAQMSFAKFFQQAGWHKLPYKTFVVKLKTILKLHKIHQPRSHLITSSFLHISEFWWNCLG